ncbi:hypothetical protein [Escherichia phage PJNS034]
MGINKTMTTAFFILAVASPILACFNTTAAAFSAGMAVFAMLCYVVANG